MKPRGFTLGNLVATVGTVSVLAALSVPTFQRLLGAAKQSEAMSNLRALNDLEQAYFMLNESYTPSMGKLAFTPSRGNRYQYNLVGTSSARSDDRSRATATTAATADAIMIDTYKFPNAYRGFKLKAMACGSDAAVVPGHLGRFLATAQGNLEDERGPDQWSISSEGRDLTSCPGVGAKVPGGLPVNERDDSR